MATSTNLTVTNFVKVQLGVLESTGGAALATTVTPPPILDVLNLRACHGAIKFGDPLTREECVRLLEELSKCRAPFQCAHGRPTVIPLLKLNALDV
jgi:DNA mismatch repair protein MLH3